LRKALIPVTAVFVVLVAAVAATAAIPGANGVIHGCRNLKSGLLRVIDTDAGQTCGGNETPLNWRQDGVSGYQAVTASADIPAGYASPKFPEFALVANCPPGTQAVGGGGGPGAPEVGGGVWVLQLSGPNLSGSNVLGWQVQFRNVGTVPDTTMTVFAWAICADMKGSL
jgi:hypothetical protein